MLSYSVYILHCVYTVYYHYEMAQGVDKLGAQNLRCVEPETNWFEATRTPHPAIRGSHGRCYVATGSTGVQFANRGPVGTTAAHCTSHSLLTIAHC